MFVVLYANGAPGTIRTSDSQIRSLLILDHANTVDQRRQTAQRRLGKAIDRLSLKCYVNAGSRGPAFAFYGRALGAAGAVGFFRGGVALATGTGALANDCCSASNLPFSAATSSDNRFVSACCTA
jgi:hypothetical protein